MASLRKTVIKEPNVGAIVKARTSVIINTVFENKKKKKRNPFDSICLSLRVNFMYNSSQ